MDYFLRSLRDGEGLVGLTFSFTQPDGVKKSAVRLNLMKKQ